MEEQQQGRGEEGPIRIKIIEDNASTLDNSVYVIQVYSDTSYKSYPYVASNPNLTMNFQW